MSKAPKSAAPKRSKTRKAQPKPGRPEVEVTAEQRERVEILVGGGMGIEEIAHAMTLSPKTLRKHFKVELSRGRSKKRAEALEAMFNSAKGGNVSAQKAYIALNAIATADENWVNPPAETTRPVKAPRIGKKEQAAEAATTAGIGTDWKSDLETPPLPDTKLN